MSIEGAQPAVPVQNKKFAAANGNGVDHVVAETVETKERRAGKAIEMLLAGKGGKGRLPGG